MIQITCEICKDLIPLVQDGVASGDSASAVERHIQRDRSPALRTAAGSWRRSGTGPVFSWGWC